MAACDVVGCVLSQETILSTVEIECGVAGVTGWPLWRGLAYRQLVPGVNNRGRPLAAKAIKRSRICYYFVVCSLLNKHLTSS